MNIRTIVSVTVFSFSFLFIIFFIFLKGTNLQNFMKNTKQNQLKKQTSHNLMLLVLAFFFIKNPTKVKPAPTLKSTM